MPRINHTKSVESPQSRTRVRVLIGEQGSATYVLLAPDDGLGRGCRTWLESSPLVLCSVCAAGGGVAAIPPTAFHRITLRWVIDQADIIVIRSSPPHLTEDGTSWCIDATCSAARFLL